METGKKFLLVTNEWRDGRMERWMEGWMDGGINSGIEQYFNNDL